MRDGGKSSSATGRRRSPPSSKYENQIASFYGLPLKFGTLDPPLAVILLPAPVYFWKPPTPLCVFATSAQVCLLFTLPARTNSKVRSFRRLPEGSRNPRETTRRFTAVGPEVERRLQMNKLLPDSPQQQSCSWSFFPLKRYVKISPPSNPSIRRWTRVALTPFQLERQMIGFPYPVWGEGGGGVGRGCD